MATTKTQEQLVNRARAAELLSVSTRTIQRLEVKGTLPGLKFVRGTRYRMSDINQLMGVQSGFRSLPQY
jgi:excisionase family DNA binding protein